jgi:hypothetical protein
VSSLAHERSQPQLSRLIRQATTYRCHARRKESDATEQCLGYNCRRPALLGFAAPDLARAQTRPTFERKYIGTWCRVSSDPEGATLRREPRGKICSPERRVVITATEVHGMFAPWEFVYPAPTEAVKVVGKFEMMHCKVEQYSVNMNGMAWVWFACSNGEHLRGVFLIDGRELATSREMLREKPTTLAAPPDVPAQYRGLWCEARDGTYYRCREATSEGYQHIHRNRIKLSEEGDCHITAVTPTTKGHRLRVYCPPGVLPDPPEHVNLRLDARGRLHFD